MTLANIGDIPKLTKVQPRREPQRTAERDEPLPLFPELPPAAAYPVNHLGPLLARAALAISRKVQVPVAMAAQSILAAASLAAQAHADVRMPHGQTRPLTLFMLTIAGSGERKTSSDSEAAWPLHKRERILKEEHALAFHDWQVATAAWTAEKRKVESDKGHDFEERKAALKALGPEPRRPLYPFLTAAEPTLEGLAKSWSDAPASLGIFSAEGGQFLGGHGMASDHRLRTAAALSELWDGKAIKRIRSLDGVSILDGRRLALHLMVQNEAASTFLADPVLRDQGLLSRVLVAAPDSIAGTRFYRDPAPEDDLAIKAYGARILSLLERPWPVKDGTLNELEPRTLAMDAEAERVWREFHDAIEGKLGRSGELHPVRDFASKAAEHAARIAGVLAIVAQADNLDDAVIDAETMHGGVALTQFYLSEALRLQQAARTDEGLLKAQSLLDWCRENRHGELLFREILQYGPAALRTRKAADEAVKTLMEHGWLSQVSDRPRKLRMAKDYLHADAKD